jgi:hypothetical protein
MLNILKSLPEKIEFMLGYGPSTPPPHCLGDFPQISRSWRAPLSQWLFNAELEQDTLGAWFNFMEGWL